MQLPAGLGLEAGATVEAVGPNVADFKVGDRVGPLLGAGGRLFDLSQLSAERLLKLPDSIDFETAAAMMLQGMTVEYLVRRTYPVKAGDIVLFHAAGGRRRHHRHAVAGQPRRRHHRHGGLGGDMRARQVAGRPPMSSTTARTTG